MLKISAFFFNTSVIRMSHPQHSLAVTLSHVSGD